MLHRHRSSITGSCRVTFTVICYFACSPRTFKWAVHCTSPAGFRATHLKKAKCLISAHLSNSLIAWVVEVGAILTREGRVLGYLYSPSSSWKASVITSVHTFPETKVRKYLEFFIVFCPLYHFTSGSDKHDQLAPSYPFVKINPSTYEGYRLC